MNTPEKMRQIYLDEVKEYLSRYGDIVANPEKYKHNLRGWQLLTEASDQIRELKAMEKILGLSPKEIDAVWLIIPNPPVPLPTGGFSTEESFGPTTIK